MPFKRELALLCVSAFIFSQADFDRKIIGWSLSCGTSVEETSLGLGEWLLKPKHHKGINISF
jgi:hypothetical protein